MSPSNKENREHYVGALSSFFNEEHIIPSSEFACKKYIEGKCPGDLARGMQCHVGDNYGKAPRVVVVSLDCGNGGADKISQRTINVQCPGKITDHMKGTIKILQDFFHTNDFEVLKQFAMTNSCKCCRKNDPNQLGWKFYNNCSFLKFQEIKLLDPDIIYFQGVRSKACCKFEDINKLIIPEPIKPYIKRLIIDNKGYLSVLCPHPSGRGKERWAFYGSSKNPSPLYKEINRFIQERFPALQVNP